MISSATTGATVTYDLRQDGAQEWLERYGLQLRVGEAARIILSQNLSTGYGWIIKDDEARGVYSFNEYDRSGDNSRGLGVPGTKEITIIGLRAGSADFRAVYARPWEFYGWNHNFLGGIQLRVTVEADAPQLSY